jgi:hypothetical protein
MAARRVHRFAWVPLLVGPTHGSCKQQEGNAVYPNAEIAGLSISICLAHVFHQVLAQSRQFIDSYLQRTSGLLQAYDEQPALGAGDTPGDEDSLGDALLAEAPPPQQRDVAPATEKQAEAKAEKKKKPLAKASKK